MGTLTGTDDPTAEAIVAWLRAEGAGEVPHAGGRTLFDHLLGTYSIARRWRQPAWLQHAALIHSIYGTDAFHRQLVSAARRDDVRSVAGERAELLAHLFSVTPRRPLLAGTYRWTRLPSAAPGRATTDARQDESPTRDQLDALVIVHMANIAEQSRAADDSPGRWLARMRGLAELVDDSEAVVPPLFAAQLAAFAEADESLVRRAYLEALRTEGEPRANALALAAAACPVVAEPCVWLAYACLCRGDDASSRRWATHAGNRLQALGTAWDKRVSFEDWLAVIERLERAPTEGAVRLDDPIADPRALLEAILPGSSAVPPGGTNEIGAGGSRPPDPAAGRRRFERYIDALADADGAPPGAIYPDLPSRPWHDPREFPLVAYLETHYPQIRDEILALQPTRFHRESERIDRTGDWDVAFLYERGRRHDEACAACPVTTRGIEAYGTVRTLAGLIYVSRMRGGTHISAHRGPTNVRVRCHLGIAVPDGDCAIRVGGETRRWQEGKCLVFDDYFVHEAWNHTDEDRLVLIVDLWHPGLSPTEVTLLEALHNYTNFHANRLGRYWAANARAAGTGDSARSAEQ